MTLQEIDAADATNGWKAERCIEAAAQGSARVGVLLQAAQVYATLELAAVMAQPPYTVGHAAGRTRITHDDAGHVARAAIEAADQ